ncbi:MAG: hypothetical protein ACRD0G_04800 [Acidimicrobiales bacterium]
MSTAGTAGTAGSAGSAVPVIRRSPARTIRRSTSSRSGATVIRRESEPGTPLRANPSSTSSPGPLRDDEIHRIVELVRRRVLEELERRGGRRREVF